MTTLVMTGTSSNNLLVNGDQHVYNLVLSSSQNNKQVDFKLLPSSNTNKYDSNQSLKSQQQQQQHHHQDDNTILNKSDVTGSPHVNLTHERLPSLTASSVSTIESCCSPELRQSSLLCRDKPMVCPDSEVIEEEIKKSADVSPSKFPASEKAASEEMGVKRSPRGIGDCLLQHEIEQRRLSADAKVPHVDVPLNGNEAEVIDTNCCALSSPYSMLLKNTPPPSLTPKEALMTMLPNTGTPPMNAASGKKSDNINSDAEKHRSLYYSAIGSFDNNSYTNLAPVPSVKKTRRKAKSNEYLQKLVESPPGLDASPPSAIAPTSTPAKTRKQKRRKKHQKETTTFRPSSDACTPHMRKKVEYLPAARRTPQTATTTMGTISRPNFRDALRRVAMIIQQHICKIERRFEDGSDPTGLFHPRMKNLFHEERFLTKRYECTMPRIAMARPGLMMAMKEIKYKSSVPTCDEIYQFAHQLFKRVQLSSECSIVCLIYVERLMEVAKVPLMKCTWKPIFMCGLLLASKVWQDLSSWNIEFATVYPQFSLEKINQLELLFLKMVKWDLYISSSLYAKYYFALRSLLEKKDFRQRYNRMVGGVGSVAASEALKIQRRTEVVKEEALMQLSRSME
mmetsp:Transcript_65444/g.77468  ORF Transcript_65444/g.77468 Transcript_65444/m.77468 type:complete len:622 (-) Transcript_65444:41-1906(-)|eukprot:CAMPEP_0172503200 /NCGR_PEP_ID=MMETSP1066-20121228/167154_1 /TAXON_ID=671091 /ORGANISM="Coscinodiscus wailesii, Strain CCMP2513" /LENGTH=621 /DNA_ID=CAMNT_0013278837 /DNA_START=161 /DNA_END=2026 /DNA_ORIENTATION=-